MSGIKLEVVDLSKKYGDYEALKNVSFEMTEGIYAILGLNGAGKTTLINLITDNIKRTNGKVLFQGKDILSLGAVYREKVGYMPQEQGYYGDFTARGYLAYIAVLKGLSKKVAKEKIEQLLFQFNLKDVADKKMKEYSGGMKQRAMLAQALLNDPDIIILDEPTAGLDPKERVRLKEYIKLISSNKIVIYCTHIISDVEDIADKIMLMKHGNVVKFGSVQDIIGASNEEKNIERALLNYMGCE